MRKKPYRDHEEATIESFQNDPRFATEYLNAVLEDGDKQELMTALRYLAKAFGGVSRVAEQAELNATTLYRMLSPQGNPELKSLTALLKAMGMRLAVQLAPSRRAFTQPRLSDLMRGQINRFSLAFVNMAATSGAVVVIEVKKKASKATTRGTLVLTSPLGARSTQSVSIAPMTEQASTIPEAVHQNARNKTTPLQVSGGR